MEGYDSRKPPNVRVTVLEDSHNLLQELFNPVSQRQQVPLIQRKLPKSFFVPPGDVNDQNRFAKLNSLQSNDHPSNDFVVFHSKANSSPACLDATLRATNNSNVPSHNHQKSLDVASKYNQEFSPEFNFSESCNTSFMQNNGDAQATSSMCRPPVAYTISDLPTGYEIAVNENNQVYFLNHQTQDTTWFDPRIPEKFQKWGMTPEELEQVHINYAKQFMCASPSSNLSVCASQIGRVSPSVASSPNVCVSNSSNTNLIPTQSSIPNNSPSMASSTHLTTSGNQASTHPSLHLSQNSSGSANQMRLSNQTIAGTHPSHPNHLPHSHLYHQHHHHHHHHPHQQQQAQPIQQRDIPHISSSSVVQHQRQHSQGLPAQSPNSNQPIVTHFRSCSQPVSMSNTSECTSNTSMMSSSNNDSLNPQKQQQLRLPGGMPCGLSASSSLTGLSMQNLGSTSLGAPPMQSNAALGSTVTSTSSGQLVQGLECLKLNTTAASGNNITNSTHLMDQHQHQQQQSKSQRHQQQQQQTQYVLSASSGMIFGPNINSGPTRLVGITLPTTPVSGTQHSHQGSMDSGVGQSLTGQSNPSANQTPEHTVMLYCDPIMNKCGTEHMEGIVYPNEELICTGFNDFDNIDISDLVTEQGI